MIGIKIVYSKNPEIIGTHTIHNFLFVVLRGTPSQGVITSTEIRQAIKKSKLTQGKQFGNIQVDYDSRLKNLEIVQYYPLPLNPIKNIAQEGMEHKGIAERLESRVIAILKRKYPDVRTITNHIAQKPRITQYEKMGLTREEASKVFAEEYIKRQRAKTLQDIKKARRLRQQKRRP